MRLWITEFRKNGMNMEKIGIVVAMDKEFSLMEDLLTDRKTESPGGLRICTGTTGGKEICLMKTGIGKVAAATGINWMYFHYRPQAVINSGVAGGIGKDLKVGDIVAGEACCYHDVDCGEGNECGQVQGFPSRFVADARLLEAVSHQQVRKGLICTGDQFITDSERLRRILLDFPEAAAVDMESAAMAQVCHIWKIPFLSLRVVSDTPCAENDNMVQYEDFWNNAPRINFELVRKLLLSI